MSKISLDRIALGCRWKPEWWHYKLADHIAPMAVRGIFADATLVKDPVCFFVVFPTLEKCKAAEAHKSAVERALGGKVFFQPPPAARAAAKEQGLAGEVVERLVSDAKRQQGFTRGRLFHERSV